MHKYKILLLVLLFLFSISLITVKPGVGNFENFYIYVGRLYQKFDLDYLLRLIILYPPFLSLPQFLIIHFFPPDRTAYLLAATSFYGQASFMVFKIYLYIGYIFTGVSLLYFAKSMGKGGRKDLLSTSLVYFSSVTLMLSSLALGNSDITAAGFLVLSLVFMFKKRLLLTQIFYLMSILSNWSLIIFFPIYFLVFQKNTRKQLFGSIFFTVGHCLLLLLFLLTVIYLTKIVKLDISLYSKVFSFSWIISQIGKILFSTNVGIIGLVSVFVPVSMGALMVLYIRLILKDNFSNPSNPSGIIIKLINTYYLYLLFFPWSNVGNLIFPVVLSLLLYIIKKSETTKILLIITNLMAFTNIFLINGINGVLPIRGLYIDISTSVMSIFFILYWIIFIINSKKIERYVENT